MLIIFIIRGDTSIGEAYAKLVKETQTDKSKYPESLFESMKSQNAIDDFLALSEEKKPKQIDN